MTTIGPSFFLLRCISKSFLMLMLSSMNTTSLFYDILVCKHSSLQALVSSQLPRNKHLMSVAQLTFLFIQHHSIGNASKHTHMCNARPPSTSRFLGRNGVQRPRWTLISCVNRMFPSKMICRGFEHEACSSHLHSGAIHMLPQVRLQIPPTLQALKCQLIKIHSATSKQSNIQALHLHVWAHSLS